MARYGVDYYGLGKTYGSTNVTYIDYDASPVYAYPFGHNTIFLAWTQPTGTWTALKIIRNPYGFPLDIEDGIEILNVSYSNAPTSFLDTGADAAASSGLKAGNVYHYGIFLNIGNTWAPAGQAYSISVKDYKSVDYLYNNLPAMYKQKTLKSFTDSEENTDLYNFLKIFGFELDHYRTYCKVLQDANLNTGINTPMVPILLEQFGSFYEPSLGLQAGRRFIKNGARISKEKGSRGGLLEFLKSYTGYDQSITMGKNLLLDYNDSSAEETVGNWQTGILNTSTGAWTTVGNNGLLESYQITQSPSINPFQTSGTYPNRVNGMMRCQTYQPGTTEMALGADAPQTKGVPVNAGTQYTFSMYTSAKTNTRTITTSILWYDRTGAFISRSTPSSQTNVLYTSGNPYPTRLSNTATAPAKAYFAVPYIVITGIVGQIEYHYFDAAQFEASSTATDFEDSRLIVITMKANRINEIKNSSFFSSTNTWALTGGTGSINSTYYVTSNNTTKSLQLTASGTTPVTMTTDYYISVLGGYWYTSSCYIRTGYTGTFSGDRLGKLSISWYDSTNTLISTSQPTSAGHLSEFYNVVKYTVVGNLINITTDESTSLAVGNQVNLVGFGAIDGTYTVTVSNGLEFQIQLATSPGNGTFTPASGTHLVQDLKTDFNRISYSALSPANAAYAKTTFTWSNPAAAQQLWVDDFMFEKSSTVNNYFDGSNGFSIASDILWEGTANASRSHYYKNLSATQLRLNSEIKNYIMYGSSFKVLVAQPGV